MLLPSARKRLQMKIWRFDFAFAFVMERHLLGGYFGPLKIFSPPPLPTTPSKPWSAPPRLPSSKTLSPPSLYFLIRSTSPVSPWTPPPKQKKKFKNIRNVHQDYYARGNKYISNARRFFDVYVFEIEFEFVSQDNFSRMCIVSLKREILVKRASYVYLIQI